MLLLNEECLDQMQAFIQRELLKRGIMAKITNLYEADPRGRNSYITLESELFQTIPVMFESVKICNFGTSVRQSEEDDTIVNVYVGVAVKLAGFKCEAGRFTLFDIYFSVSPGEKYVEIKKIT